MANPFKKILDHELPKINLPKPTPEKESIVGGAGNPLPKTPAKKGIGVNPFNNVGKLENLKSIYNAGVSPEEAPKTSLHGNEKHIDKHSELDDLKDFNPDKLENLNSDFMRDVSTSDEISTNSIHGSGNHIHTHSNFDKFNNPKFSENNTYADVISNKGDEGFIAEMYDENTNEYSDWDSKPLSIMNDSNLKLMDSIYDEPLVEGLDGSGGVFNFYNDVYSDSFRIINKPSLYELATSGNIMEDRVGEGYNSAFIGINRFINTGGILDNENASDIPIYSPDIVTGDTPEGNGEINIGNSSWFYSGTNVTGYSTLNFPNDNPFYQFSGAPDSGIETRTNNLGGVELTSGRLGFDDLSFDSLYNSNHTSGLDNRLNIRYTNSGNRGEEPYQVYDIGTDRSGDSQLNPYQAIGVDTDRLTSFLESPAGELFIARQTTYQNLFNRRRTKNWNPSSVLAGGQFNRLTLGIKRSSGRGYLDTVFEEKVPGFFGPPGMVQNIVMWIKNKVDEDKFLGGNAFQVLGFNKYGHTDFTNVAPPKIPASIGDTLFEIGKDSAVSKLLGFLFGNLQTTDGGMAEKTNPRKLAYTEQRGFLFGSQLRPIPPYVYAKLPGNKLGSSPSLKPWKDIDQGRGGGMQPDDDTFTNKKAVELKPYKNIPDGPLFSGPFTTAFEQQSDFGEYERKAGWGVQKSLEAVNLDVFDDEPLPDEGGQGYQKWYRGDFFTNLPISPGKDLAAAYPREKNEIELARNGYPLYFKDLRDDTYLFFRGYLEGGLTETVTANWSPQTFLGRSEDSYTYSRTTRDIQFTLKLFAQTKSELHSIYEKLEKLTSLCYPQFRFDDVNFTNKLRAKPPLTKFRLADMYGARDNEMTGFIKSLTYSVPDNAVWEHEQGSKVPKHITAAISYQVLHKEVPHMLTQFYGKKATSNIHYVKEDDTKAFPEAFTGLEQ